MAQISLAWILSKPGVTAPVVGTTSLANLEDLLGESLVRRRASDARVLTLCKARWTSPSPRKKSSTWRNRIIPSGLPAITKESTLGSHGTWTWGSRLAS